MISLFKIVRMTFLDGDIEKVTAAAAAGDPNAQAQLAWRKINNDGVTLDRPGGIKLAKESANKGCKEGLFTYGFILFNGLGCEEKQAEGVKYFLKAAEQNFGPALYQLADCYIGGMGVPVNEQEAEKYYHLAEKAGFNPIAAL